jgi:glutamate dehydrogenase (NAD(P)+)
MKRSFMDPASYNPFQTAQKQFDRAADLLDLDQPTRDFLRYPMREYNFCIPIRMDDGKMRIFRGFRVQHNDARGPAKGGIRFHPQETIDTIRAMAMWMTWKTAVADLPLGGGNGGVICDPHDLSDLEQEKICRSWVRQVVKNIGPYKDIPAPDIMTRAQHMLWMLDEFEAIKGEKKPGFITGKPVGMGGSLGRLEATGYGIVITIRETLKDLNIDPKNTLASIQGFGNVGRYVIKLFQEIGTKVLCVASWDQEEQVSHSFYKKEGIDLEELSSIANHYGEIDKNKAKDLGYQVLSSDAWLSQDVDILVPAALENQITEKNVGNISRKVKIIAEGANGPTTPEADQVLKDRGLILIPDLLANSGGVTCSYFEQVQSNMNYYWERYEVLSKLDVKMTSATLAVFETAEKYKLSLRDAAYVISVDRVVQASHDRGWI